MFFSFDGIDGVGKTTQMDLFCRWLAERGETVVTCRDPGCTPLGERVREILLTVTRIRQSPAAAEMLLYMAARAQLVDDVIRPALGAGKIVVSDRYLLANLVYQGHAGGLDIEAIRQVGAIAVDGIYPDAVFLLDMPPPTPIAGSIAHSIEWNAKAATTANFCERDSSPRRRSPTITSTVSTPIALSTSCRPDSPDRR